MVFDNDLITELVITWQLYGDDETFEEIINLSSPLVEAIASGYGYIHRDDLIQESFVQLQHALESYNESLGSAYSYVCAVVRNCCVSYLRNENKHDYIYHNMPMIEREEVNTIEEPILAELTTRNRCRFPTISVDIIDTATRLIFMSVSEDSTSPRGIVKHLMVELNVPRPIATILYQSSLVWLRFKYKGFASGSMGESEELSLLPDLQEYLGKEAFDRISLLFSGMYLKIP